MDTELRRELKGSILDNNVVNDDVMSRLWFTYRTGFAPIGQ